MVISWKNWALFENSSIGNSLNTTYLPKENEDNACTCWTYCLHLIAYIWGRPDENALQIMHLYWTSHFPNMTTQRMKPIPPTHYWVDLALNWCQFCLVNESVLQYWHHYLVWWESDNTKNKPLYKWVLAMGTGEERCCMSAIITVWTPRKVLMEYYKIKNWGENVFVW